MPRFRIPYNSHALFIGPAPASGNHFIDARGGLNDFYWSGDENYNLIHNVFRAQSLDYSFDINRNDTTQLGRAPASSRSIIEPPTVNINYEYLQHGIINEVRAGLVCNISRFWSGFEGEPLYHDNFQVDVLSGFTSRDLSQPSETPFWPPEYRDKRNLFLVINPGINQDIFNENSVFSMGKSPLNTFTHVDSPDFEVISFGNCYLQSYNTNASIGDFPRASMNFVGENIKFDSSGSGVLIPAVEHSNRSGISDKHFNVPHTYNHERPSVLRPGDITMDFSSREEDSIVDLGHNFENLIVQGYNISLDLNREPLNRIGHKLPEDRQVNFPVFVDLFVDVIVNEQQTGSLVNAMNKDGIYDISIKMKSPECLQGASSENGEEPSVDPDTLGTIELWLKADSFEGILSDGDPVGTSGNEWEDQSDNNLDATTNSTSNPIWKSAVFGTKNKPAVRFGGSDTETLTLPSTLSLSDPADAGMTIIAVVKSGGGDEAILGHSSGNEFARRNGPERINARFGGTTRTSLETTGHPNGAAEMISVRTNFNTVTTDDQIIWVNKTNYTDTGDVGGADISKVGGRHDSFRPFAGDIAEIIIYSNELSDADIENLFDNYVVKKYGLTT